MVTEQDGRSATPRLGPGAALLLVLAALGPYALLPAKPLLSGSLLSVAADRSASAVSPVSGGLQDGTTPGDAGRGTAAERPAIAVPRLLETAGIGRNPAILRLLDMMLHAAGTVLLALLLLSLATGRKVALAAAAVFAVHPVLSEAVCSVAGRADLVASLAMLAGLLLHVQARRSKWPMACEAAALLSGVVALLARDYAITFPLLLVGTDLAIDTARDRRAWADARLVATWVASGLLVAGWVAVQWSLSPDSGALPPAGAFDNPLRGASPAERWSTVAWLFIRAGRLAVLPIGLSCYHGAGTIPLAAGVLDPRALAGVAFIAILGALAVWSVVRFRDPRPTIGVMLFLLPLGASLAAATGGIVPFAERWLYLPVAGAALLLAPALGGLARRAPRAFPVIGAVVLVLAAGTALRVEDWSSRERLARATLRWYPDASLPWLELGLVQAARGETAAAAASFRRSLAVVPERAFAWQQYATAEMKLGDFQRALAAWRSALDLSPPDLGPLWRGLGTAQLATGRSEEAVRSLQTAHRLMPDDPHTRALLARAQLRLAEDRTETGRREEGARFATRAISLGTLDSDQLFRAALVLYRAGHRARARALFEEVLAADPEILRRKHELAVALDAQGQHLDAARVFAESLAARPDHAPTLFNLGRCLLLAGRAADAIAPIERGLELRDDETARRMLAEARARARRARR